jgi:assimilatory nitrate reductase catalytic subunit
VSEARIGAVLAGCRSSIDVQLAELQQTLACGTQCGSCLPELKRLVRAHQQAG